MGAVTGAVAGGLLGNTIGKGNGRVAFTASRTFLGTVFGNEVEKSMDTPRTIDYANNPFVPTHQSPCDVCSGFTNECAKSSCKRGGGLATIATFFQKIREKRNRDVLHNWWQWWQPHTLPGSYSQKPFRLRFDRR